MGNPSLIAKLGLDPAEFTRGLNASESGLKSLQEKAKLTAAEIALLERKMADGKTDAMVSQHAGLQATLRATQAEAKAAALQLDRLNAIKDAPQSATPASRARAVVRVAEEAAEGGGHGHGLGRGSKQELFHSGRAMVEMLAAGQSPGRALETEAPRLVQALAPLAPALSGLLPVISAVVVAFGAAAAAAMVYRTDREAAKMRSADERIGENSRELMTGGDDFGNSRLVGKDRKARSQERARLTPLIGQVDFENDTESKDSLDAELKEATEQVKKERGARQKKGNYFANLFGRGRTEQDDIDARDRKNKIRDRRDDRQESDIHLDERAFAGDPAVASDKLKQSFDERINTITEAQKNGTSKDGPRQIQLAQEAYGLAVAELARKKEAAAIELNAEEEILAKRIAGKNVAVETAAVRVKEAEAMLRNGPSMGPEHAANVVRVNQAKENQSEQEHTQRETDADLALRTRNAGLHGSAENVAFGRAVNDRDAIQSKIDDPGTKDEEKKRLAADLAEANGRLTDLKRASAERGVDFEQAGIQENTGRGPNQAVEAIEKELDLLEHRRALNKQYNDDDAVVDAQINAEAAQLKRQKDDILFTEQQSLTTLGNQLDALKNQGRELDANAKKKQIDAQAQQRIDEANHDNDPARAAKEKAIRDQQDHNADVDESMLTPAQRLERMRHNNDRARADAGVDSRARLHAGVEAANAPADFTPQHMPGASHMPGPEHMPDRSFQPVISAQEVRQGSENAGKSDGGKDFNSEGIIAAVNGVTTAVTAISFKNQ